MCNQCKGNGRYYEELPFGVKVIPCLCEDSMLVRQAKELEFQNLRKKIVRLKDGRA